MSTPAPNCICGKHLLELFNEGTCLWCGHGQATSIHTIRDKRLAALPRELGDFQREGRRLPFGVFENVTRIPSDQLAAAA